MNSGAGDYRQSKKNLLLRIRLFRTPFDPTVIESLPQRQLQNG
jgi:hypothetical protein